MRPRLLAWATLAAGPWLLAQGPPACPQWREDPSLLGRLEQLLAGHVDAARSSAGAAPLVREDRLAAVARQHARHLASLGVMAHQTTETGAVQDRLRAAGIVDWDSVGENLAVGTSVNYVARPDDVRRQTVACHTPESLAREIAQAWRASAGHNRTLLDARFTALGGGAALDAAGQRVYVVHDFARLVTCGFAGAACCPPPEGLPGGVCQAPLHCRAGRCLEGEPLRPAPPSPAPRGASAP